MTLVKVGVYCLAGGCHWATYDDDDASACGTKGPDVFIDVDPDDYALYPEWLQRLIVDEQRGDGCSSPEAPLNLCSDAANGDTDAA